jgi:hypothetical protein
MGAGTQLKRKWWNWQTHHLEGVAPTRRAGSSPAFRTILVDIDQKHHYYSEKLRETSLRIIAYSVLLLTLCFALAFAGATIRDGSLQARSDGNDVTIQWGTTDESFMKEFVVEREGNGESGFVAIGSVPPKGSGTFYEFVDQTAFKTVVSVYQYRIKIVSMDGGVSFSKVVTVSHNVSGVKRTWGSLKAMFR